MKMLINTFYFRELLSYRQKYNFQKANFMNDSQFYPNPIQYSLLQTPFAAVFEAPCCYRRPKMDHFVRAVPIQN